MDKYEIFDYIIQSRVAMKSMSNDLLYRAFISLHNEVCRREEEKGTY